MIKKLTTALIISLTGTCHAFAADIVVGVPNWPSVTVSANVIKAIIEKNFGSKVELQTATNPVIFEAMDKGSMQIHPEVWLPNQQGLVDQYAAAVEVNKHPAAAVQGICANKAAQDAGFNDISELTDPTKTALLDTDGNGKGELYIGATGWASTLVEKARAHGYGYDQVVDLVELDESVAYAQLSTAIETSKPWVGFCYKPHYLFTQYPDIKLLKEPPHDSAKWKALTPEEDPNWISESSVAMTWPTINIQPAFAKRLETENPQVALLLKNIDLTSDDLGAFSYAVVIEKKDPSVVAIEFISANPGRVTDWLK